MRRRPSRPFRAVLVAAAALPPAVAAASTNASDDRAYAINPIVHFRPNFSRSLPVQILVTAVILTLLSVLLIQLIFTAQYHWRLARTNFVLQVAALLALLASTIASLVTILDGCIKQSSTWPYMIDYIAVDLPPLTAQTMASGEWSQLSLVYWHLMNATWGALIQITHIQFLTLMYPSRLEASLIFVLLGPLSIIAAIMNVVTIRVSGTTSDVVDAVRNVCNASLALLFTVALFLWGFAVNRKQAWRTDGGTAVFGGGALFLAIASCALTFLYIPSAEQYDWMPMLTGAVMLWQSFLGWWWWVGAGMGMGEVEDFLRREEKRRRKRQARDERRREQKERARELWFGVASKLRRRRTPSDADDELHGDESPAPSSAAQSIIITKSLDMTSTSGTPSSAASDASLPARAAGASLAWLRSALTYLRASHMHAAQERARAQADRYASAYGDASTPGARGWGLGHFGVREQQRRRALVEEEGGQEDELVDVELKSAGASPGVDVGAGAGSGMWWWGPLRRWRLQDSTTYS